MTWEPRPTPEVTPESEPYWAAASEGTLLIQECENCGLTYHYPRSLCPDCFSENVQWVEASGTGEVYSYSTARTISGWPEKATPLIVAYVELDEGPRIMTDIHAEPESVNIGTRVKVKFVDSEKEKVAIPVFVPLEN